VIIAVAESAAGTLIAIALWNLGRSATEVLARWALRRVRR